MPDIAQLHGPLAVTLAYLLLWYAFLFGLQTRTKYRLEARYAREDKALGATYVGLRALYPLLLGREISRLQSRRVSLVTFPSYLIVFGMLGGSAWAAFGG